jgi:hypothetical protein
MAWKTFDDSTAAALKERVDEGAVSVESQPRPLFDDGDSVVIAPTLQKGAALVIIARRKTTALAVEEPPASEPVATTIEESPGLEALHTSEIEESSQTIAEPDFAMVDPDIPLEPTVNSATEFTFGPTTWERADEAEPLPEPSDLHWESRSTDPGVWEIPSQGPPKSWPEEVLPRVPSPETKFESTDRHYVATGFLGLDDYAEDDEEIARTKRPWWKRIFTD